MGKNLFKLRLTMLGKTQTDLFYEVQKRGYPTLGLSNFSRIALQQTFGPQAMAIRKVADGILSEWEKEMKKAQ